MSKETSLSVINGSGVSQRAINPKQYDLQDLSWEREGGNARTIQYWSYLQAYTSLWAGKRVLDVGCGDGWLVNNMLRSGAQAVLGIEPSHHNRLLARHRYPKLLVEPYTFEGYQSDSDSFDVITAILSLNHVADIGAFFTKAHMMLSAGGHIIIVVPDFDYWRRPRREYKIDVQEIDDKNYACAVTRPSGTIADLVRQCSVYKDAAKNAGVQCVEELPMPPSPAFLKLAPGFKDAAGNAITHLMRFQKA